MSFREDMVALHCPRYAELPDLELYMDQVISVLEKHLSPFSLNPEEPPITSTMINNYVKLRLIPPPAKKRYHRDHLAQLIICTLLKQVLTLGELDRILTAFRENSVMESTYNRFCEELENALHAVFGSGSYMLVPCEDPYASLLRTASAAFAFRLTARILIQEHIPDHADADEEAKTEKAEKKKKKKSPAPESEQGKGDAE